MRPSGSLGFTITASLCFRGKRPDSCSRSPDDLVPLRRANARNSRTDHRDRRGRDRGQKLNQCLPSGSSGDVGAVRHGIGLSGGVQQHLRFSARRQTLPYVSGRCCGIGHGQGLIPVDKSSQLAGAPPWRAIASVRSPPCSMSASCHHQRQNARGCEARSGDRHPICFGLPRHIIRHRTAAHRLDQSLHRSAAGDIGGPERIVALSPYSRDGPDPGIRQRPRNSQDFPARPRTSWF